MSTLTFLGADGGCGTTTLAALSAQLLAKHTRRVPTMVAEDPEVFTARLGELPQVSHASEDQLGEHGRYSAAKAATALGAGHLIIVGAATPRGLASLAEALDDIAGRFGQAGLNRTLPVQCAAFGVGGVPPEDSRTFRLPFDPSLVPGGPVSDVLPQLRAGTQRMLRQQWLPVLAESFAVSR